MRSIRLIDGTGRQHLGQGGVPVPHSSTDAGRVGLLSADDLCDRELLVLGWRKPRRTPTTEVDIFDLPINLADYLS